MNINKLWLRRQTTKFNGVPYLVQRARCRCLYRERHGGNSGTTSITTASNAKVLADALDECGVWYCGGKNSPYIWLRCPGKHEELGVLRLAAGHLRRRGHPGRGLRRVRRGLLPPDRIRRCREDQEWPPSASRPPSRPCNILSLHEKLLRQLPEEFCMFNGQMSWKGSCSHCWPGARQAVAARSLHSCGSVYRAPGRACQGSMQTIPHGLGGSTSR